MLLSLMRGKQEGGWSLWRSAAEQVSGPLAPLLLLLRMCSERTQKQLSHRHGSFLCWMTTVFHNICLLRGIIKAITCTPPLTSSHMLTQAISQGLHLAAKSRRRNTHSETICHHSPTLLFKLVPVWNSSALEKKKEEEEIIKGAWSHLIDSVYF